MVRSLLNFALAWVILAAPVATEVCEATCAARDSQKSSSTPASHHSCHQVAAPQSDQAIDAIHVCGHDDGIPTALERAGHIAQPPAAASTIAVAAEPPLVISAFITPVGSSPPTPLNLISQLRV